MSTTAAPPTPTTMPRRREMVEVKAPAQFSFDHPNDRISGILIDIDQVTVKGKPTMQYMLQDETSDRFTFLATYDLNRKIQPAHIGHFMSVTYEGEDHTIETQGSPLRRFEVKSVKTKSLASELCWGARRPLRAPCQSFFSRRDSGSEWS